VGLVVPDPPAFAALATKVLSKTVEEGNAEDMKAATRDDRVKKEIATMMDDAAKQAGLQG
jgi:long-chain acyl-CoA synthetase